MGADYIVQSFMTFVVGGVGNVWGTLAGASLIGFRPKGIVALKGRAAGQANDLGRVRGGAFGLTGLW